VERVTRRIGAIALRLTVSLVVTAVALVGTEYVLRFVYRNVTTSANAREYLARRDRSPAISVNTLGFREREIPPKQPGRYRIVIVGDSFTWGQGVEPRDRFSDLLGQFLGPHYEVFNFGQPGNNMPEHLDVLTQALQVQPDFVLLQLYINDFETPDMGRPQYYPLLPARFDRALEGSSILYDLSRARWVTLQQQLGMAESYAHYLERNLLDADSPKSRKAFGQLQQFIERARAAGAGCGTVLFPGMDAMGAYGSHYSFGYLHDRVRMVCSDEKIPCVDLLSAYSTYRDPRSLWVSPFDAHPNAVANRRAAYEILDAFASRWSR